MDPVLTPELTTADLDAMRARLAAADPPPWRADIDDGSAWTGKFYVGEDGDTWCTYDDGPRTIANVRLVENAPEDMRRLLAEVDRLRAELAARDERDQDDFMSALTSASFGGT